MLQQLVIGNAADANASATKGWVVGHFMPEGLGQTGDFEIKIWHYNEPLNYGQKVFDGTEFFIVEAGSLRAELDIPDGSGGFSHREVKLNGATRDYIIIPPNCIKRVVATKTPSYGVTVRWPSAPGNNVVIREKGES